MFSRIRDFLYRHRRKFLVGGIIFGGATLLSRYAERKLLEWHNEQTQSLLEKQKKRQHYENTLRTSNATVMSLAESIREMVARELDADTLLQAVKDQPQHKLTIWEQLKIVGFSRAVSCVYVGGLVSGAIRVQLMLLGGYTFCDLMHSGHAGSPISQSLQQKYLTAVHFLMEEGMPKLVQHITKVVTQVVTGIPLNRGITLIQLEGLFHEIRLSLSGEETSVRRVKDHQIEAWSKYVLQVPILPDGKSEEEKVLYNMLIETCDVLESEDFNTVMDTLIYQGFNLLLDRLADFYPPCKQFYISAPPITSSSSWVNNVSQDAPQPSLPSLDFVSMSQKDPSPPLPQPPPDNATVTQSLPQQNRPLPQQEHDTVSQSLAQEDIPLPHQDRVTAPQSSAQQDFATVTHSLPQQNPPLPQHNLVESHSLSQQDSPPPPPPQDKVTPSESLPHNTNAPSSGSSLVDTSQNTPHILTQGDTPAAPPLPSSPPPQSLQQLKTLPSSDSSCTNNTSPKTQPNNISTLPHHSTKLINTTSVPVAKLIPVLSGLIHAALSPMPGQLLQKLLTNDRLDSLGANVYEVYTVPLGNQ